MPNFLSVVYGAELLGGGCIFFDVSGLLLLWRESDIYLGLQSGFEAIAGSSANVGILDSSIFRVLIYF